MSTVGLTRYHAVSLGGLAIYLAMLQFLIGGPGLHSPAAQLAGIATAAAWNFSLSLHWTWRPRAAAAAGRGPSRAGFRASSLRAGGAVQE